MNDPILELLTRETPSAEIVYGESAIPRIYFEPDEYDRVTQHLAAEIELAKKEAEPRWAQILLNQAAYEGKPTGPDAEDDDLVVPICKRNGNQLIAWLVQMVFSKKPFMRVRPKRRVKVPTITPLGEGQGQINPADNALRWAKEVERFTEFLLTQVVDFRDVVTTAATDMVTGANPAIIKYVWDESQDFVEIPGFDRKGDSDIVAVRNEARAIVINEEYPLRFLNISPFNFLMRAHETNIQAAAWCAERLPDMSPTTIYERLADGTYDLCRKDPVTMADIDRVLGSGPEEDDSEYDNDAREIAGRGSAESAGDSGLFEMWFNWPLKVKDPATGTLGIEILSLQGHFAPATRTLFFCQAKPYRKRPFVPIFYRKRPHQFSGGSPVEDAKPYQEIMTSMYRLALENGAMSTLKAYLVRRGSEAERSLDAHAAAGGVPPGGKVTFDDRSEVEPFQTGSGMSSMANEMAFANNDVDRLTGVTSLDQGFVPGRTADAAIARVLEQSKMQSSLALESLRRGLAECVSAGLELIQQNRPFGESFPTMDSGNLQEASLAMPEDALISDELSVIVAASAEDDAREVQRERETVVYNLMVQDNTSMERLIATFLNPQLPEAYEEATLHLILRQQRQFKRLLDVDNDGSDELLFDEQELRMLLMQKRQAIKEAMAAQNAAAMGGGNAEQAGPGMEGGAPGGAGPEAALAAAGGGALPPL